MEPDVKLSFSIGAGPIHEIAFWFIGRRHASRRFTRR